MILLPSADLVRLRRRLGLSFPIATYMVRNVVVIMSPCLMDLIKKSKRKVRVLRLKSSSCWQMLASTQHTRRPYRAAPRKSPYQRQRSLSSINHHHHRPVFPINEPTATHPPSIHTTKPMSTSKLVKTNGAANGSSSALFAHNMPSNYNHNHNGSVVAGGGAPNIWQLMNYPVPRGFVSFPPSCARAKPISIIPQ